MSEILLRNMKVVDPGGPHHDAEVDVLVRNGVIEKIGKKLPKGKAREVKIARCAHQSGMGGSARAFPRSRRRVEARDNQRIGCRRRWWLHRRGRVAEHIAHRGHRFRCGPPAAQSGRPRGEIVALGAITKGLKGEQLAELHDLHTAGAVGFSDDQTPSAMRG